ncbi:methyl-accepting chemotaxis protein, partial [Erythrobacter sp. YJ-T3-07]|nr:methyl-accepting chemotaxis protein [Erythrobacter sp. YJ-T3-07]
MQDVVAAIEKVTTVIAEISHASGEQLERVTQVGLAVNQIDQGTQQNAALVEQTSASAESLHDKADMLVATVGQFRIAPSP